VEPAEARAIIAEHGLTVHENLDLLPRELMVEATPAEAAALALWDEVAHVYAASDDLAARRPVHSCGGALTAFGPVSAMAARIGDGWDGPGLGRARLGFYLGHLGSRLTRSAVEGEISRALAEWSRRIDVDFAPAPHPALPRTLAIDFAVRGHGDGFPFDGPGRILAHTFYPQPPNPETIAGDLHFDEDENWGVGTGIDVYSVALHEVGHALGLGHSDRPGTVMYPYYARATELTPDDIAAIRTLYAARGAAGGGDPEPPSPPLPDPPEPPGPKPKPGGADAAAPTLTVLSPAASSFSTYDEAITIRGSARDPGGVVEVTWTDSLGNTGVAHGAAVWTAGPVPLRVGTNAITIRARDTAGNLSWRSLSITRRRR
jgi:hypothetical protein